MWVNVETGVYHWTKDCGVAQRTREDKIRLVASVANGLRCRTCYDKTGAQR
jgi:hypothetical protein